MDRFKFRIPFYDNENNFLRFKYIEVLEGLGAYNYGTCHHGDPEQCTDLKDTNGKLIYEGDIITDGADKFEVVWDYNAWCIQTNNFQHFLTEGFEVIGNIHENKDLLEE